MEPRVTVTCLKRDLSLVEGLLDECSREYTDFIRKELDVEKPVEMNVNTDSFLELRTIEDLKTTQTITKTEETKKW